MEEKKKKVNNKKNKVTKPKTNKTKKTKNVNKEAQAKNKDTKMKFKYKHPKLSLALKIFLIVFLIACVIGAGVVVGLIYGLWGDDLKIDLTDLILSENSVILDSEGNIIAELNGDENRKIITLQEMSPYLPKAYIAIEDERFKKHHGVDIKRTGAAILSFVTHGGESTAGGGSTITQQVVKNITQEKSSSGLSGVIRKLKEWVRAYEMEKVLSKDQILELYLNLIFVGGKNYGVEIGAEYYFNKSAKDLSIAQCAFLAGINNSPNRYNPYGAEDVTERISKRTKTVLSQMKKLGYITEEEYNTAIAEVDAGFTFENGAKGNVYSSHVDALLTQLTKQIMEEKQLSEDAAKTYLYSSGLRIYSTQVTSIQEVMENEAMNKKYNLRSKTQKDENGNAVLAQGAAVVIDPKTGYVVGCIGQLGEKTTSRGLNRALSLRQTGSSFKPLADIIPGIEEGVITPATLYADLYTVFGKDYDPDNYNGFSPASNPYRSIRSAVTTSQNIPFIKVMAEVGVQKCMEYLKKMGFTTLDDTNDASLPLAIGGLYNGVSPLEMAAAYATIANNGTYIEPTFYSKVEDTDGNIVMEPGQKTERAFSEDTAYIVKDLLTSVVTDSGATASYCAIKGMDVAAKTGTTNESKDRWLCGFTNYYACAAWYGFDQPERISFPGTNPAGQLFDGIMTEIHKGLESSKFEKTSNIVTATVCRTSGRLATDKCTNTYSEIFIKDKLPETCDAHQNQYTICKDSGKLPNEFCPQSSLETKSSNYVVEKERLGLWNTPGINTSTTSAPTEYCDVHTKPVETVPEEPEEPETPTEPSDGGESEEPEEPETGDGGTDKPTNPDKPGTGDGETDKPTDPDKPGTGDGSDTGSDSGSGNENNNGSSSGNSRRNIRNN